MTWPSGFTLLPGGTSALGYAVSADGSTVVGQVNNMACYWTEVTGPTVIGPDGSVAWDVSGDGSVIVGNAPGAAFYWTAAGGMVTFSGSAHAVDAAGSGIVGSVPGTGTSQPAYWDRATLTQTNLPLPPGYIGGIARSISDNGTYIVGDFYPSSGVQHAFRWTAADGMTDLGLLSGWVQATGQGVADDGTVVGFLRDSFGGGQLIFIWTPAGGMATPFSTDLIWGANAISGDASTIYGYGWWPDLDTSQNDKMAYAVNGIVFTPTPTLHPDDENHAAYDINTNGLSHNGKVMVGYMGGAWVYNATPPPPDPSAGLEFSEVATCTTLPAPPLVPTLSNLCSCPPCNERVLSMCKLPDTFSVKAERKC